MENNINNLETFKHSFLKAPRKVLNVILDVNHPKYTAMRIYLFLLTNAYYSDGYIHLCRKKTVCHRGEYIGIYEDIGKMLRLSKSTVCRYMKDLQEEKFISIKHLKNAVSITITGYDDLCGVAPAPEKKPSRAPRKKANEAPAPALATFQYGNNTRPVVYDDQGQIIMDGDEARRVVAEREKKENCN